MVDVDGLCNALEELVVDRTLSPRKSNPVSSRPGGKYHVVVHLDPDDDYLMVYENIHWPRPYVKAIVRQNPEAVCEVRRPGKFPAGTMASSWRAGEGDEQVGGRFALIHCCCYS